MNIFAISFLIFYFQLINSNGNVIIDQVKCLGAVLKGGCPNKKVTFWLYNKNAQDYLLDEFNKTTISNAPWVPNTKTVLILHGYTRNKSVEPNIWLRPEYMTKGYNIISADYPKAVPDPCYVQSAVNVRKIGKCTAVFIETLLSKTNGKVELNKLLVVGFSLGAHVAGRAGSELKKKKITLNRIVGLDPAFPLFNGPLNLITKNSANFVMIIHTNMFAFGNPEFSGHVDFVVNYGIVQQHCLEKQYMRSPVEFIECNHDMAPQYYAESINSEKFFCGESLDKKKYAVMGENTAYGTTGVYHVITNNTAPFAIHSTCNLTK
ncbi:phospholipase A1-like [Onthophagus taurus]|uniref:phospholipase A1-like n=1 Tax=Onthophagus taurus TaxID=166361 RepID=UPI000C208393|nr:phospholipase A1-like isoform X2 [Onthophagus taurus]